MRGRAPAGASSFVDASRVDWTETLLCSGHLSWSAALTQSLGVVGLALREWKRRRDERRVGTVVLWRQHIRLADGAGLVGLMGPLLLPLVEVLIADVKLALLLHLFLPLLHELVLSFLVGCCRHDLLLFGDERMRHRTGQILEVASDAFSSVVVGERAREDVLVQAETQVFEFL
jgi:hypothetical protein